MVNIPSPPTDNLYKFMAISGIAISLTSIFFPLKWSYEVKSKGFDLEKSLVAVKVEYQVWEGQVKLIAERIERSRKQSSDFEQQLLSRKKEIDESDMSPIEKKIETSELFARAEFHAKVLDEEKRLGEVKADANVQQGRVADLLRGQSEIDDKQFKYLKWWDNFLMWILMPAGVIIGVSMTCRGFYLWYVRVQKLQDRVLLEKASHVNDAEEE